MSPPDGYTEWLSDLNTPNYSAQQRAALAVNRELVLLYWQIGRDILARQAEQGWAAKVIERLAHYLRTAVPGMKGVSPRNLKYMRAFLARSSICARGACTNGVVPPIGGAEREATVYVIARYREAMTGGLDDTTATYHQILLISMDRRALAGPKPEAEFVQQAVAQLALG